MFFYCMDAFFGPVLLIFMSILLHPVQSQPATEIDLQAPPVLQSDLNTGNPGVKARLTTQGTGYAVRTMVKILAIELPSVTNASRVVQLQMGHLSDLFISDIIYKPETLIWVQPPDRILLSVKTVNCTISGNLSDTIAGRPLMTRVRLEFSNVSLSVDVSVLRNQYGSPQVQVNGCGIEEQPLSDVTIENNRFDQSTVIQLQTSVLMYAPRVVETVLCDAIYAVIATRINMRFDVMSPKIPLSQKAEDDIVQRLVIAAARDTLPLDDVPISDIKIVRKQQPIVTSRGRNRLANVRNRAAAAPRIDAFIKNFNLSRIDDLILDYSLLKNPAVTPFGIEMSSSGETSWNGYGGTPFFPPTTVSLDDIPPIDGVMLQLVVTDYVPNTLMYHGHRMGLFNTRIDSSTPQFGQMMRSTCDLASGVLFCLGDIFPTLRRAHPDRFLAMSFVTNQAPALIFRAINGGMAHIMLTGSIAVFVAGHGVNGSGDYEIGKMDIDLEAFMKMRVTAKTVKGKVSLEKINLKTRTPNVLLQEELDDAGFLSREVLQRMVNDILKDGVPMPVHPLFKMRSPKLAFFERSLVLSTDFVLNQRLLRQLTSATPKMPLRQRRRRVQALL